jgi:hypothetical protein
MPAWPGVLVLPIFSGNCVTYEDIHLFVHAIVDNEVVGHPHSMGLLGQKVVSSS